MSTIDPEAGIAKIEAEVRPLVDKGKREGGYDCCGCSTYDWILDHAIAIVRGQEYIHPYAQAEGGPSSR